MASLHQASFASAAVYLVRELENVFPSLESFTDQLEIDQSDDEEIFKDMPDDSEVPQAQPRLEQIVNGATSAKRRPHAPYDGRKRDPQHSNADNSCVWELVSDLLSLKRIMLNP